MCKIEYSEVNNLNQVIKLTYNKLGISSVPTVTILYGIYRSSWHLRRLLEYALYLKKGKIPYIMTHYNFGLVLNPKDKGFSRNILWGKRESFATDYLYKFLSVDEVCFDIGANIGYYVNVESQCCKEGEIYAFEPVSDTFKILKKNLPHRARAYKIAMGDFIGNAFINVDSNRNLSTITKNSRSEGKELIQCITLDSWIENRYIIPTFIRMDTEGFEVNILRGAKNLIHSNIPLKLFIETHPTLAGKVPTEDMIDDLLNNGFKIRKIFLWNTSSDSPFSIIHDKWIKIQSQLEEASIDYYGEIPPTMETLHELNQRGIGCHLFMSRGED